MNEINSKLTGYQRLSRVFDIGNNANPTSIPSEGYDQEKQLLTSATPEEAKVNSLEARQDTFFHSQQTVIVQSNEQQQLLAQSLRLPALIDYSLMEGYPILAQALNVLSEEATTSGENGKMLTIYSDNKKIKVELETLFNDRLDLNVTLPVWCRNMVKYGDNFLFLQTRAKYGITGIRQLPAAEITVRETFDRETHKTKLEYLWQNQSQTYTQWQIAHFRMLGDDRTIPYGASVLGPVRTYWRMLRMQEDAMLVYRAVRASERRVIKVNVGNMDAADIPAYIQATANRFKKTSIIDQSTGLVNYKFNPASVEQDIFVPTRSDNATNPIETLAGATNLSDIEDITYLRSNLFSGLGIPKIFLAFSEDGASDGGGKNLSNLDIRFARKINRIQQCLIAELNKIAIIHLVLRGYDEEELTNFTLALANPSTQADMLKVEHWAAKMDLYVKATTAGETGIKPMSETRAKQQILGMSNDEIMEDIQQQMVEAVVGDEIKNATIKIKNSKIFDGLYKYYEAGIISQDTLNGEKVDSNSQTTPPTDNNLTTEEPPLGETPTDAPPENATLQEKYIYKNNKLNENLLTLLTELEEKNNKQVL